ncbi:hypothetical protein KYY02_29570 [Streptomyces pimonensis]|uniref:DDE Tnp4 domain-containing protein n=1 Tax=Streptomyces pimonensis TaxID=2860288 RepID=A0ABV4J6Z9_9ACTN
MLQPPIDRVAADRPFCSGKHHGHGMNVQVPTGPFGKLIRVSPALAGAVHDIGAARSHGLLDALDTGGIRCWADTVCQGSGPAVRVPFRGRRNKLSAGKKAVNRAHVKIRALGEQAMATLKSWRLPRKLRCGTTRVHRPGQGRPHPGADRLDLRRKPHCLLYSWRV